MLKWDRIGLLRIDIEGRERVFQKTLVGSVWLTRCIECRNDFSSNYLRSLTECFGFLPLPERVCQGSGY